MKTLSKLALGLSLLLVTNAATAIPTSLEGMGVVNQWRDSESTFNTMIDDPWGNSDDLFADRVGIYVKFADGQFGSATYSGITSTDWNQCCDVITTPDSTTGFFTNAVLHGLNANPLWMAWHNLTTPYSDNFDLEFNDSFGTNFRANTTGWGYADFGIYSSVAAVVDVPEPTAFALIGLGLVGLAFSRRRSKP